MRESLGPALAYCNAAGGARWHRATALGTGMTRGMEQSYERLDEQVAEAMRG
jgi:hypothetical protein